MKFHSCIGIVIILTAIASLANGECVISTDFTFPPGYDCKIDLGGLRFSNGQLFTYKGTCNNGTSHHWSAGSLGRGTRVVYQADGNLVVYSRFGEPLFASFTNCKDGKLVLKDDGNLVMLTPDNQTLFETGPFEPLVCPCECEECPPPPPPPPGGGHHSGSGHGVL